MSGHPSAEDAKAIEDFVSTLESDGVLDRLLDLAQALIEPAHEEATAVKLVEAVLAVDPDHRRGRVLWAFLAGGYLLDDDSLRRAVLLIEDVVEVEDELAGVAYSVLGLVTARLGTSPDGGIRSMEESVRLAPSFVANHQTLGGLYAEEGRVDEAIGEFEHALANVLDGVSEDLAARSFDDLFAQRFQNGDFLRRRLAELRGA